MEQRFWAEFEIWNIFRYLLPLIVLQQVPMLGTTEIGREVDAKTLQADSSTPVPMRTQS